MRINIPKKVLHIVVLLGMAALLLVLVIGYLFLYSFGNAQEIEAFDAILISLLEPVGNASLTIILSLIPAILGISYPVIIQTIMRLQDTYNSSYIVQKFREDKDHVRFVFLLKFSAGFVLLSAIYSSVLIITIVIIQTGMLLVVFFRFLEKILTFLDGEKLSMWIINQYPTPAIDVNDSIKRDYIENFMFPNWNIVMDFFEYSAEKDNGDMNYYIRSNFIIPSLNRFKEINVNIESGVELPEFVYNRFNKFLIKYSESNGLYVLYRPTFFCGQIYYSSILKFEEENIHRRTFLNIWKGLVVLMINNKHSELYLYWQDAHYFSDSMGPSIEHDENFKPKIESLRKRKYFEQRQRNLVQFHTVLCAYAFYKSQYGLLSKFWGYTKSLPERHPLIISSVNEIFTVFEDFGSHNFFSEKVLLRYWFDDVDFEEIGKNKDVSFFVRIYSALLFLKLWNQKCDETEGWMLPFPNIPIEQNKKIYLKDRVKSFSWSISWLFDNKNDALDSLDLIKVTTNIQRINIKNYSIQLNDLIDNRYSTVLLNEPIDDEALNEVPLFASKELEKVYNDFKRIAGQDVLKEERDAASDAIRDMHGLYHFSKREAFLSNSGVSYVDFDKSITFETLRRYRAHIFLKFRKNSFKSFKIEFGQQFEAIDRLQLTDGFVIVIFNTNIQFLINYYNLEILEAQDSESHDYTYKGFKVFVVHGSNDEVSEALYVLNESHLPMIKHEQDPVSVTSGLEKSRWEKMTRFNEDLGLYFSYTDYALKNESDLEIWNQKPRDYDESDPRIKLDIDFIAYCWFNKNVQMIEIIVTNEFNERQEKINELENIKPFHELVT